MFTKKKGHDLYECKGQRYHAKIYMKDFTWAYIVYDLLDTSNRGCVLYSHTDHDKHTDAWQSLKDTLNQYDPRTTLPELSDIVVR